MGDIVLTKHKYMDLSKQIWEFIQTKFPQDVTPEDLANAIAAMEAVKFGISKTLEENGHRIKIIEMSEKRQ